MPVSKKAQVVAASAMRRKYKTPPINEAVCAFYFSPDDNWNVMYPAMLYDKIKSEYSGKPREQKLLNIEANPKEIPGATTAAMAVNEITRTQFVTEDGKKIVGINKDQLSISVTRPYPGWEVFRPTIESALAAYRDTANPKGLVRVGLRYINQLDLSASLAEALACFSNAPPALYGEDARIENFASRLEYLFNDDPIKVAISFARLVAPPGKISVLLDVDLTWESPADPLAVAQTMTKVDDMRGRERVIFEALITDRAREIFDA